MNDSPLREILPLLRPRTAEPTLFTQTVWYLLWLGVATLVSIYFYRLYRMRRQRHARFLAYCRDAGLSDRHTRLIERIARARKITQPERLIANAHAFERQVGAHAHELAQRNRRHPRLKQIARLREELGFDELPSDQALISTRQIERGQTVMISQVDARTGQEHLVPWLVIERDEAVLELSPLLREAGGEAGAEAIRRGDELAIRFWRDGDTEYFFHTQVLSVDGQNLTLRHAARVERMQQRDFFRIHVDFPIDLFGLPGPDSETAEEPDQAANPTKAAALALLNREDGPDREVPVHPPDPAIATERIPATAVHLRGRVQNLSAGGLAVLVGGDTSRVEEDGLIWMVDPAFEGDFPLAGVTCRAVSSEPARGQVLVKMRFEALPPKVEKEIVQRVYQYQLDHAGGVPAAVAGADPPGAGDQAGGDPPRKNDS